MCNVFADLTKPGDAKWEAEQAQRRHRVQSVCSGDITPPSKRVITPNMVVDHKHRVLYCHVPKAACSNWKNMICQLMNKGNKTNEQLLNDRLLESWPKGTIHHRLGEFGMEKMRSLNKTQRAIVMASYTKIIAVRHPFERIKSVYTNKLYVDPLRPAMECQTCKEWGRAIYKRNKDYRENHTQSDIESGRGVTFPQFFDFAVHTHEPHWTEQERLCLPCTIKYDYIMKVETMTEDAKQVIRRVFNSTLPFVAANPAKYKGAAGNATISTTLKRQFIARYKRDADIFGYTIK